MELCRVEGDVMVFNEIGNLSIYNDFAAPAGCNVDTIDAYFEFHSQWETEVAGFINVYNIEPLAEPEFGDEDFEEQPDIWGPLPEGEENHIFW